MYSYPPITERKIHLTLVGWGRISVNLFGVALMIAFLRQAV